MYTVQNSYTIWSENTTLFRTVTQFQLENTTLFRTVTQLLKKWTLWTVTQSIEKFRLDCVTVTQSNRIFPHCQNSYTIQSKNTTLFRTVTQSNCVHCSEQCTQYSKNTTLDCVTVTQSVWYFLNGQCTLFWQCGIFWLDCVPVLTEQLHNPIEKYHTVQNSVHNPIGKCTLFRTVTQFDRKIPHCSEQLHIIFRLEQCNNNLSVPHCQNSYTIQSKNTTLFWTVTQLSIKKCTLFWTVTQSNRKIPHCSEQLHNPIKKYHTVLNSYTICSKNVHCSEQLHNPIEKYHTVQNSYTIQFEKYHTVLNSVHNLIEKYHTVQNSYTIQSKNVHCSEQLHNPIDYHIV